MPRSKDLGCFPSWPLFFFLSFSLSPPFLCPCSPLPWGQMDLACWEKGKLRALISRGESLACSQTIGEQRECLCGETVVCTHPSSFMHHNYFFFCLHIRMCVIVCVCVFLCVCSLSLLLPGSACLCLCLLCRVSFAKLSGSRTVPISKPGRKGCVSRYRVQDMPVGPYTHRHTWAQKVYLTITHVLNLWLMIVLITQMSLSNQDKQGLSY